MIYITKEGDDHDGTIREYMWIKRRHNINSTCLCDYEIIYRHKTKGLLLIVCWRQIHTSHIVA